MRQLTYSTAPGRSPKLPDIVDVATRSRMMSGIRGRDTKPERLIRSALHRRGLRFRLHTKDLPGRPDLVLSKFHAVIFVHGCFWHGHDCRFFKWPSTRREFWAQKISDNRTRDRRVRSETIASGWRHLTVWECAIRGAGEGAVDRVADEVVDWLVSGAVAVGEIRGEGAQ